MKKLFKYACFSLVLLGFAGCEDPEIKDDLPYYFHESIAYLDNRVIDATVFHSPDGIVNADLTVPFNVNLSKPLSKSCRIQVEATVESEGITPDDFVISGNGTVTIPANTYSGEGSISFPSWDFCLGNDAKAEYRIALKIAETSDIPVSKDFNDLSIALTKTAKAYTTDIAPTEGAPIADRSGWIVSVMRKEGTAWTVTKKLTDDNLYAYEYTNNYLGIQIDLGSEQTVTGLQTVSGFGASYAHTQYTLETSSDGTDWTKYDEKHDIAPAEDQYIMFYSPVTARYIRWYMYGDDTLSSEIYVYAK